ncbi:MAG: hypothetical protein K2X98_05745 [Alphaproteobacteria bacterium]|nr:hypothetical protein [Alphaproteobacteria bacterium]
MFLLFYSIESTAKGEDEKRLILAVAQKDIKPYQTIGDMYSASTLTIEGIEDLTFKNTRIAGQFKVKAHERRYFNVMTDVLCPP